MTGDYGGQRANMEDDSMVGTLAAQAAVLWPKERDLLRRRFGTSLGRVLDCCCGTGEALKRIRADFRPRFATGVDLFRGHLRSAGGPVVQGDALALPFGDGAFDLVLVRHVLQAIPDPVALMREARRVLRKGGRIHVIAEDYAGLFFDVDDHDVIDHFHEVARPFRAKGTDLFEGRRAFRHLREAGFREVVVEPLLVDNQTSDRRVFADIFRHWRDGYAPTLAVLTGRPLAEIVRRFDAMIDASLDPGRHTSWLLFALSATA